MSLLNQFKIIRPSVIFYQVLFAFLGVITAQILLSWLLGSPFSLNNILWVMLAATIGCVRYEYKKMKAYHSKRNAIMMPHD